jgi:hypothetical protein
LQRWRNVLLCYRVLHHGDKIPNIKLNLKNREKQLFKPVLRLFQNTTTFDELCDVMSHYARERRSSKNRSLHAFLCNLMNDMIQEASYNDLRIAQANDVTFPTGDIWTKFKTRTTSCEIPGRPLTVETAEFGSISQRGMTMILEDILKAAYDNSNGERKLRFSKDVLRRVSEVYSHTSLKIQKDSKPGSADSADSADRGSVGGDPIDDHHTKNTQDEHDNDRNSNEFTQDFENNGDCGSP